MDISNVINWLSNKENQGIMKTNLILAIIILFFFNSIITYRCKYRSHIILHSIFYYIIFFVTGTIICKKSDNIYNTIRIIFKDFVPSFAETRKKAKIEIIPVRWYTVTIFFLLLLFFVFMIFLQFLHAHDKDEDDRNTNNSYLFFSIEFCISFASLIILLFEIIFTQDYNIIILFLSLTIIPIIYYIHLHCKTILPEFVRLCIYTALTVIGLFLCPTGILDNIIKIIAYIVGGCIGLVLKYYFGSTGDSPDPVAPKGKGNKYSTDEGEIPWWKKKEKVRIDGKVCNMGKRGTQVEVDGTWYTIYTESDDVAYIIYDNGEKGYLEPTE